MKEKGNVDQRWGVGWLCQNDDGDGDNVEKYEVEEINSIDDKIYVSNEEENEDEGMYRSIFFKRVHLLRPTLSFI